MHRQLILASLILAHAAVQAADLNALDAGRIIAAASDYARAHQAPGGAIAVVDDGGHLVALLRLDGSFPAAAEVAIGKARTAALFRKPTRVFEDLINQGRVTMTTVAAVTDFTPLQGGVPLLRDAMVIGAIGVSGAASAAQDEQIAQAAVEFAATLDSAASVAGHGERP